jgi:cell division protein ZapA
MGEFLPLRNILLRKIILLRKMLIISQGHIMESRVKVNIYGNEYNIAGEAEPEYILKLADFINTKMKEIGKTIATGNTAQIAILTALNIADEYFQLQDIKSSGAVSDVAGEMEKKTRALISMLDEGLIGDIFTGTEPPAQPDRP